MTILVCGSRNWVDSDRIEKVLSSIIRDYGPSNVTVAHGAARGADSIAAEIAEKFGCLVRAFPAEWHLYNRAAGPIRNRQMLHYAHPDMVIAFHEDLENSKGTLDMVTRAQRAGIPTYVYDLLTGREL